MHNFDPDVQQIIWKLEKIKLKIKKHKDRTSRLNLTLVQINSYVTTREWLNLLHSWWIVIDSMPRMSTETKVHSRPQIELVYSYNRWIWWINGRFLSLPQKIPNIFCHTLSLKESGKTTNGVLLTYLGQCCGVHLWQMFKSDYTPLWMINYFPPCNPQTKRSQSLLLLLWKMFKRVML